MSGVPEVRLLIVGQGGEKLYAPLRTIVGEKLTVYVSFVKDLRLVNRDDFHVVLVLNHDDLEPAKEMRVGLDISTLQSHDSFPDWVRDHILPSW
jgi:hypothetical protein